MDEVVERAHTRFSRGYEFESHARQMWLEDYKFSHGDSDNNYQWPDGIMQNRDIDQRPALTINKTRIHNLQVINELKKTRPSIKFRPTGGKATKTAADYLMGLVRHIEYSSRADLVYGSAIDFQVNAGVGYWRVITEWDGDDSFNQRAKIELIADPLTVLMDPDTQLPDRSDAEWALVFRDLSREEFDLQYPGHKDDTLSWNIGGNASNGWEEKDQVRVAEYYERQPIRDEIIGLPEKVLLRSSLTPEIWKQTIEAYPKARRRKVIRHKVMWYLIAGKQVIDEKVWAGKTIPIVELPGEVTLIDGQLDRKSHTRYLKSAQQMYNFWTSAAVEHVALQGKTPWIASADAIEGHEDIWENANTENYAVLPWNSMKDGVQVPPPQRAPAPQMAQAYLSGMQVAQSELMMASGQYQAEMGEQTPERSGLAIEKRQNQSDNATYHFDAQLGMALQRTGAIMLEIFPVIYDVERMVKILAEDGSDQELKINPFMDEATRQGPDGELMINPSVGKYEVQAQVGPSYDTMRENTFEVLNNFATQAPTLFPLFGDILFEAADFYRAGDIAERLKRMVPPQALGGAPAQELQQLQQEVQKLQQESLRLKMANEVLKAKGQHQQELGHTELMNAETNRLKVLLPDTGATDMKALVQQILMEILGGNDGASNAQTGG